MESAKERMWKKLEAGGRFHSRPARHISGISFWRRNISIPIPAAAAAAAVFIVTCATLWVRQPVGPELIPQMALASENSFETPGIIPVADMNGVLQYLDSRDNEDVLILQLPESRSFMTSGEPVILKAADYSRSQP
jgi:hypothetical protein